MRGRLVGEGLDASDSESEKGTHYIHLGGRYCGIKDGRSGWCERGMRLIHKVNAIWLSRAQIINAQAIAHALHSCNLFMKKKIMKIKCMHQTDSRINKRKRKTSGAKKKQMWIQFVLRMLMLTVLFVHCTNNFDRFPFSYTDRASSYFIDCIVIRIIWLNAHTEWTNNMYESFDAHKLICLHFTKFPISFRS